MFCNIFQNQKNIRQRFSEVIKKNGFKQVEISRQLKVNQSTLSQWIQGKAKGNRYLEESIENWLNNIYLYTPSYAGTNITRWEELTNKGESLGLNEEFDNNSGFDNLVQIKLNIEIEGKKYKDEFMWNVHEPYLSVENFAQVLVTDYNLPPVFKQEIINQMKRQINLFKKFEKVEGEEIIKSIKVDIHIGNIEYSDQFEWDISNPNNDPEEFAKTICQDLGLGIEFVVPIAYSIKEQIIEFQKNVTNEKKGYFYGNNYYKQPNKKYQIDCENYLRDISIINKNEWEPHIKEISDEEIKRKEKIEERKNRYAQRKK